MSACWRITCSRFGEGGEVNGKCKPKVYLLFVVFRGVFFFVNLVPPAAGVWSQVGVASAV